MNIFICDSHGQRLSLQTHSAALLTRSNPHKRLVFLFHRLGTRLPVSPVHIFNQSLESHRIDAFPPLPFVIHFHFFAIGSVNQNITDFLRIIPERRVQTELIMLGKCLQNRIGEAALLMAGLPSHSNNGTLVDAQRLIRNHQLRRKLHLITETETHRTSPERIVERKTSRFNLVNADAAVRTGKALTEIQHFLPRIHHQKSLRQLQCVFHGIGQSLFDSFLHNQTVHNNLYGMLNIFIQFNLFGELVQIAVNAHTDITAPLGPVKHLHMLSLSSAHNRRKYLDFCPLRKQHNLIHHLVHRLLGDNFSAFRAMRNTYPCIE